MAMRAKVDRREGLQSSKGRLTAIKLLPLIAELISKE
jgi:hypothetical protein